MQLKLFLFVSRIMYMQDTANVAIIASGKQQMLGTGHFNCMEW